MTSYAGSFLVARTSLLDPNFRRSVVLLVQHNAEGAFGLIVNRPVPVKELPYPIFAGGPCEAQGLFMLHGKEDWAKDVTSSDSAEIAPGIFLGNAESANYLQELPPEELTCVRMFAGYAGWGPGQLEGELAENVWALVPADGKTLFEIAPKDLWIHLKPPSLPEPSVN